MSGIYIKGMEIPKNCGECLLAKLSPTGESLICNYILSRVSWEEIPFDCPFIPVPEHGRLIDADAFERHECNGCDGACEALPCDCTNCDAECRCDFMLDIHSAPTIIPADHIGDANKMVADKEGEG